MKHLLVVVDIQKDFVDGALGTAEAVAIVENAAKKIREFDGEIFVTYDSEEVMSAKYNYAVDKIYHMKNKSGYDKDNIKKILEGMFDDEGNDLITNQTNVDIMLPFYKKTEEISMNIASKTFNKKFIYKENNLDQKKISFTDNNGYKFYTYLDGYYEDDKEIIVIEVKATTSNSFKNFGPTVNKVKSPIFKKNNNIYEIDYPLVNSDKKYSNYYQKLFDRYDENGKYIYDIVITSFIMQGYLKENNINKKINYFLAVLNSEYIFDGKYILLAEDGENLKTRKKDLVKIVEGKFWLNNHAHIFRTKENVDLEYLYYYLLRMDLSEYITGSTQPKLNQENMNQIQIKLPKYDIQKKVSKILLIQ